MHGTTVRNSTLGGDGIVDQDGGNVTRKMDCRLLHVPSGTGENVTRRLEVFAVGDALVAAALATAAAVGNGAPVGGAPTEVESSSTGN